VKKGFTIFEVLLAIGILVTAFSVIIFLQTRFLFRVFQDQDEVEKTFLIKKELYNHYLKPPKESRKYVKKLEDSEMTLTTIVEPINKKSSLEPLKDLLRIARMHAVWKKDNAERAADMVTFVPKLEKEKEKKQ
jgi:hypothetical protein